MKKRVIEKEEEDCDVLIQEAAHASRKKTKRTPTTAFFPCDECFSQTPGVRDCEACEECAYALQDLCYDKERVKWDFVKKTKEQYPCDTCQQNGICKRCQECAFKRQFMFLPKNWKELEQIKQQCAYLHCETQGQDRTCPKCDGVNKKVCDAHWKEHGKCFRCYFMPSDEEYQKQSDVAQADFERAMSFFSSSDFK